MSPLIPLPEELKSEAKDYKNQEPSYDLVIPGHVMKIPNKHVNMGAKSCYGIIRSLAKRKGYCWANNPYLAKAMGVTPRCIQKYLEKLKEHDLIVCEYFKEEDDFPRRIWLKEEFEINFRYEQKFGGGTNKNSPIYENRDTPSKEGVKNRKKTSPPPSEEAQKLAMHLRSKVAEVNPDFSEDTEKWPVQISHLLKKKTLSHLLALIDWIFKNDFWNTIIVSPKSLQKNLSKLEAQFHKRNSQPMKKGFDISPHKGFAATNSPLDPRQILDFTNWVE